MKILICKPSKVYEELKGKIVGFDVMTEGLNVWNSVNTVSIYDKDSDTTFVFPVKVRGFSIDESELVILKNLIGTLKVIGNDLQFDISALKYQYNVAPEPYQDIYLMTRVLQKKKSFCEIVLNLYPQLVGKFWEFKDVITIPKFEEPIEYDLRDSKTLQYIGYCPYLMYKISEEITQKLYWASYRKVYNLEMQFLPVAIDEKLGGLKIDKEKFLDLDKKLEEKLFVKSREFEVEVKREVKFTSSADISKLLFEDLKLPATPILTSKRKPSTNADALSYLEEFSIVADLIEIKRLISVIGYAKKIPEKVDNEYKLRFSVEQIGYDGTSRVYTSNPSINQLPSEIREVVIPEVGKKFVYFDWSAAELYIAGYMADCKPIIERQERGEDLHTYIAQRFFAKDIITDKEREIAKIITFAIIYGTEGNAISRKLKCSAKESEDIIEKYFIAMPEIAQLIQEKHKLVREKHYTTTIIGRRRSLPEIASDDEYERKAALRRAFNTAIQGSCGDFFKMASIKLNRNKNVRLVCGVFDSFLLEVPEAMKVNEYLPIIEEASDFTKLFPRFKFKFKHSEGMNWKEVQDRV